MKFSPLPGTIHKVVDESWFAQEWAAQRARDRQAAKEAKLRKQQATKAAKASNAASAAELR